jgi:alanyl-tRNA synthetase
MKSSEIRQQFLDYFASKGHAVVASSQLIPGNDPTLLFTNAGMVQFKDVFLGDDKRAYSRAVSSQRCVRAGGKHNDLENVGYTARHHTFFEMLGNFSFGDYFKRNAIEYAWEFLTGVMKIPAEKLMVTVYHEDDEAFDIWANEIGVPTNKIVRIGDNKGAKFASDNFWQMGDTGPCGPCTEIFYDHGADIPGGPPGSPDEDGDRFIEIWNVVFMQFNRDENGVMHPLPKPSVDTGMGLERIAAVMQHVHSNYEIDLFQSLIKAAARETGCDDLANNSLRVIADHIRACSFLLTDGVTPSNEGRGYVLRRIIRRAIRHGYKLNQKQPFFHKLVSDLSLAMGAAYPELVAAQERVANSLRQEEERFAVTLEHGMGVLEEALKKDAKKLDGETAFKLYDTFGFPIDLTSDIARERDFAVDMDGFESAMSAQRERARAASKFTSQAGLEYEGQQTEFVGYSAQEAEATILALYRDGVAVSALNAGEEGIVVLDSTPFYAESGGQAGDKGELAFHGGVFQVEDTQKIKPDVFGHRGKLGAGKLSVGERVKAYVDGAVRQHCAWNHSATHLMHAALRKVLGEHVVQKGSAVDACRTRFDFAHTQSVTAEELRQIETLVNQEIRHNHAVNTRLMAHEEAVKAGAMALFGEKYGDEVRVVGMGEFSTELCGGTHVKQTGDIGLFKIVSESGVAAGIRRIEAVTGAMALELVQGQAKQLDDIAGAIKAQPQEIETRLGQVMDNVRHLEKELARLKSKMAGAQGDDLAQQAVEVGGVKVLAALLEGADVKTLRETLDKLKDKLGSSAIVLAAVEDGKVALIAGVSADQTSKIKAGELVNFVAQQVGGKGGGRPDMAQAGGTQPENLNQALAGVVEWVKGKV